MYSVWLKTGSVYRTKHWSIAELFFQANYDMVSKIVFSRMQGKSIVLIDMRKKEVKGGDKIVNGISNELQAVAA